MVPFTIVGNAIRSTGCGKKWWIQLWTRWVSGAYGTSRYKDVAKKWVCSPITLWPTPYCRAGSWAINTKCLFCPTWYIVSIYYLIESSSAQWNGSCYPPTVTPDEVRNDKAGFSPGGPVPEAALLPAELSSCRHRGIGSVHPTDLLAVLIPSSSSAKMESLPTFLLLGSTHIAWGTSSGVTCIKSQTLWSGPGQVL